MASTMLCVTTPAFSDPSGYQLSNIPQPTISEPKDVLIKVHAASINPVDVKKADGTFKMALKDEFPYKIGYDLSGIVTEVGSRVTRVKVGDEVYVRLPEVSRGSWAEYAKCEESFVALKPKSLSFAEAAAMPLAATTALQALSKYRGDLAGKTVFIPAGLSGTGSYALQFAKNVFHAGKVITTVSTAKIEKVPKLLGEGVVDQIIDYTKEDPTKIIPNRSVDFILDTTGQAMAFLSLMVPSTSLIISISTTPSGKQLQESTFMRRPDRPQIPFLPRLFLDGTDAVRKYRARRWAVEYSYLFLDADGEYLDRLARYVDDGGKVTPVVGSRVDFRDIEKVREASMLVYRSKGGIGKTVFEMV